MVEEHQQRPVDREQGRRVGVPTAWHGVDGATERSSGRRSFSVGQGATFTFEEPNAAAAVLNRVKGAAPATIAGEIDANGISNLTPPAA